MQSQWQLSDLPNLVAKSPITFTPRSSHYRSQKEQVKRGRHLQSQQALLTTANKTISSTRPNWAIYTYSTFRAPVCFWQSVLVFSSRAMALSRFQRLLALAAQLLKAVKSGRHRIQSISELARQHQNSTSRKQWCHTPPRSQRVALLPLN